MAWLDGEPITLDEIRGPVAFRIYRLQVDIHSLLVREIERQVDERLLAREALRRGTTPAALLAEAEVRAAPVAEAEVDRYLEERPQVSREPEARLRARHYLEETRRIEGRLELLRGLRERADFRLGVAPPSQPRTQLALDDPRTRGPADAPVTIVHFASFASRASARSARHLARLASELPGSFRWAHADFLDRRDETALLAARVGRLARDPQTFWALHDALFAQGGRLDEGAILRAAGSSGLGDDAVLRAQSEADLIAAVKRDIEAGLEAGVLREPTLFVNGRYLSGLVPYEELRALLREELDPVGSSNQTGVGPRPGTGSHRP